MILAIDPGSQCSALVLYHDGKPEACDILDNNDCLQCLRQHRPKEDRLIVIEDMQSFGMPVGREVFETVRWSGRFQEALESRGHKVRYIPRSAVKLHLCGSCRAKDGNIRAALIDRYGGSKEKAIGTKKAEGPLYGLKRDMWSALALAITAEETKEKP